ncbi:MAG: F0F1 ATP synthase subunit delta [Puniceicoccales bacterium]|nr:F0F1 ATP synthase subunit delta [Puniceicoccales bacterium]
MEHLARRIAALAMEYGDGEACMDAISDGMSTFSREKRLIFFKLLAFAIRRWQIYGVAVVQSPGHLGGVDVERLSEKFSKKLGRPVQLINCEDRSLIAGIRVTVGDQRWEMSLGKRLEIFQR